MRADILDNLSNRRLVAKTLERQSMTPEEFCDRWFRPTEEEKQSRGYRQMCVNVLSKVLKVTPDAVQRWGKGLKFEKMPEHYCNTLAYADIIRQLLESTQQQTDILETLTESLKTRR